MITRSILPAEVSSFYDRTLLDRAVANFVHTKWAQVRPVPRNAGTSTIKFRRYANLTAATTPLSEGVTPAGSNISTTEITAVVYQYGDYTTITDVVSYESKDAVLTEISGILGDQASDTLDQLTRDIMAATTTVQRVNGRSTRGSVVAGDIIDVSTIKKAVRTLKNNKCKKLSAMVDPTQNYNTVPLNMCYVGIIHPNISYTLRTLPGFVPVEKYPNGSDRMPYEIGSIEEVRFIETTNAKVFEDEGSGSIDVYGTLIFGMNAYATSSIDGESMKTIFKPLGSAGTADALDQRQTLGWKAAFTACILNDNYILRLESSAAA